MATPARGKKRLVVDVDLELDSEVEVASAFSRLSVSVVAKRTGESSTGDGCGFEHSTGKQRTSSKEWTSGNELTWAATSGTCFCGANCPTLDVKLLTLVVQVSSLPLL
jgi:hypothetical protein